VLYEYLLHTLACLVYSAKLSVSAGELAKQISRLLDREYSSSYISAYLKRLEKWGFVRPFKNPVNGHLLWWRPAETRITEIIWSELECGKVKKVLGDVERVIDVTGGEDDVVYVVVSCVDDDNVRGVVA